MLDEAGIPPQRIDGLWSLNSTLQKEKESLFPAPPIPPESSLTIDKPPFNRICFVLWEVQVIINERLYQTEYQMDMNQVKKEIHQDPILSKLSKLAREKKIPLFVVGGYLRNLFIGTPGKDYDFTLSEEASFNIAMIEETLHLHFFKVGKEEMKTTTYRIMKEDLSIDLTFLQGETIEEDLQRRDFTINAIAFSLQDESFHWVKGSLEDIRKKVIRTVSTHSIDQDPLRMLRAIRYLCTLDGFVLEKGLREEISSKKRKILNLPGERIKSELDQILLSPQPAIGMKTLYESDLFLTLFPELKGLENLGQSEHHHLDVLFHTLLMIEKISWAFEWAVQHHREISLTPEDRLSLYYAALFHDIGKQDTFSKDEKGKVHFYYHETFSVQAAEKMMEKLHFSNLMKNKILHLIKNHMRILNLSSETKETALKRLVNQIGDETPLLILHTLADKEASRGILSLQMDAVVEKNCLRILELFKEKEIVHPPPLITGHDVMALGYSSGPRVGQILDSIRQKQVEGEIKNREEALRVLKEKFGIEGFEQ
jgi:putative nucleotidyltransferase with HDIG domain